MQIMEGKQPQSEDFTGFEEVSEVGAGESGHMGVAGLADGRWILGKFRIFDLQEVAGKAKGNVFDVVEGCDTSDLLRLAQLSA